MTPLPVKLDPERLATAKLLVASGTSIKEAADRVGLNYEATKKAAWRQNWPSATRVAREVDRRVAQRATEVSATSLMERGAVYEQNIAQVATKFAAKASGMDAEELFNRAGALERLDRIGRRTFRLDGEREDKNAVNIAILGNIGNSPSYPDPTMEAQTYDDGNT
jgi:hypothetical protein